MAKKRFKVCNLPPSKRLLFKVKLSLKAYHVSSIALAVLQVLSAVLAQQVSLLWVGGDVSLQAVHQQESWKPVLDRFIDYQCKLTTIISRYEPFLTGFGNIKQLLLVNNSPVFLFWIWTYLCLMSAAADMLCFVRFDLDKLY